MYVAIVCTIDELEGRIEQRVDFAFGGLQALMASAYDAIDARLQPLDCAASAPESALVSELVARLQQVLPDFPFPQRDTGDTVAPLEKYTAGEEADHLGINQVPGFTFAQLPALPLSGFTDSSAEVSPPDLAAKAFEEAEAGAFLCTKCLPTRTGAKGCRACMGEWFEQVRSRKTKRS